MSTVHVSPETYDKIVAMLDQARDIEHRCCTDKMTLANKLELLAEAKTLREKAMLMR